MPLCAYASLTRPTVDFHVLIPGLVLVLPSRQQRHSLCLDLRRFLLFSLDNLIDDGLAYLRLAGLLKCHMSANSRWILRLVRKLIPLISSGPQPQGEIEAGSSALEQR